MCASVPSLFSRNWQSTCAIWGMKFHNPPVGSGLGPWQERLVWAHGTIHPSEPSSPGWTIGSGSMGHHHQTINVWWTSVMAPATNLTALVAWTAHMPASTHVWCYNLTAPQCQQPGLHIHLSAHIYIYSTTIWLHHSTSSLDLTCHPSIHIQNI